jgi:hypothetical protein
MDKNVKNTMLISPNTVKASTYLVGNVDDGMVGAAIREAQEVHLQSIIGSELLYRIQELVYNAITGNTDTIDDAENECYKDCLDNYITPYMEEKVQAVLVLMVSYKTRNLGVIHASDTNLNAPSINDVLLVQQRYNGVAAKYATALSKYLCQNKPCFPELTSEGCNCTPYVAPQIGKTFVNIGLWLGGKGGLCCD